MPIGQSASSLEYIRFTVKATVNGAGYNPTNDVVQFGFVPANGANLASTVPTTWLNGSWETDTITGQTVYVAKILVGPGGTFVPSPNTAYWLWLRVQDSPEIPVRQIAQLQIT